MIKDGMQCLPHQCCRRLMPRIVGQEAHDYMESNANTGKIILTMD
jgi:hypothetical protein